MLATFPKNRRTVCNATLFPDGQVAVDGPSRAPNPAMVFTPVSANEELRVRRGEGR